MRRLPTQSRGWIAAATALLLATGGLSAASTAALADDGAGPVEVTEASFTWGMSGQYQGGNPANTSCNYFSAGEQLEYAAEQGNAHIVHDGGNGLRLSSDQTKCTGSFGGSYTQLMVLTNGTGTADAATGEAHIAWDAAVMANAYGGLVPWSVSEISLDVDANGSGALSATLGGYGSSMENPDELFPLEKTEVTLATFSSVEVTGNGITVQPDYAGVEIEVPAGQAQPQDRTVDGWGSWPQSVVDFHVRSGLSSYWYSSGGAADKTKAPHPFTVRFDGAPEIRTSDDPPVITAQTKVAEKQPVVNGRSITVTASASGADSVRWERSLTNKSLGAYEEIPGATGESLAFTATADWNAKYVRMVAENGGGSVRSSPALILTTDYTAPHFAKQPTPVYAIDGYPARLTAEPVGFPGPVQAQNRIEISHDGGENWAEVPDTAGASNGASAFVIPKATMDQNGALIRAVTTTSEGREAGSPGETTTSEAVKLTVLPARGTGPQLAVATDGPLDATTDTTVVIVGAGYALTPWSESIPNLVSYLDVALFAEDQWQPGSGGLKRVDGLNYSINSWTDGTLLSEHTLWRQTGTFVITATIPAGTLDPAQNYGVGSYVRTQDTTTNTMAWNDRTSDAWASVLLEGQFDPDFMPNEADLTDANRGGVSVPKTATAGTEIDVTVGQARAGDDVRVYLFSEPRSLGTPTVGADGAARVTLPEKVTGEHRIAVYTQSGTLIGWGSTTISAASTGGENGNGNGNGEGTGTTPGGTGNGTGNGTAGTGSTAAGTGSGQGVLSATGADGLAGMAIAAIMLLALGAGVAVVARRRARTHEG